jgi:hypothetical protein
MLTKMEHLFFFFHILQNQFSISHVPHMMHEPQDNLCGSAQTSIIWGWFLIMYYKCMHLIIHFNPGATWLFLHTSFISLPVQHSHRYACYHRQHRCLIAAHNHQHFQAPVQESI